jgi:hypothetical protein
VSITIGKALFEPGFYGRGRNRYVVAADGQRFFAVTQFDDASSTPIKVVVNWAAELKR